MWAACATAPPPASHLVRYAAIMGKIVAQHLGGIAENATGGLNNPLGLLSFDAGFMNTLPTFGQRTSEWRSGDPRTPRSEHAHYWAVPDALWIHVCTVCGALYTLPPRRLPPSDRQAHGRHGRSRRLRPQDRP